MFIDKITSAQNPRIKDLLQLQEKSKERRERGLFVVEGRREFRQCLEGGYLPDTLFYCPELFNSRELEELETPLIEVSKYVYEKIALRGSTEGIVAVLKSRELKLEGLKLKKNPLIIVLEGVEKPGNLGAVLRSAEATGVDAIIVCDPLTDLYNPNLIRASIGSVFLQQVVTSTSEEAIGWLKKEKISILTAQLQDSELYYDTDMRGAIAIVLGKESEGLSQIWREAAERKISIPMLGKMDSLNVSVSAAILCYEAVRQRHNG